MRSLVDDGPFYLRFLVDAEDGVNGCRGRGFAERVVPANVDRPWQRPFVRMRTFATDGDNSMWLPLFSGPRSGRLRAALELLALVAGRGGGGAMSAWVWAVAAAPMLPLTLTMLNVATWRRGERGGRHGDRVSVLVPARNEEASIEDCVRAIAARRPPRGTRSSSATISPRIRTPAILAALRAELGNLRVISGGPLPDGWVGKPHACHQLAEVATGGRAALRGCRHDTGADCGRACPVVHA